MKTKKVYSIKSNQKNNNKLLLRYIEEKIKEDVDIDFKNRSNLIKCNSKSSVKNNSVDLNKSNKIFSIEDLIEPPVKSLSKDLKRLNSLSIIRSNTNTQETLNKKKSYDSYIDNTNEEIINKFENVKNNLIEIINETKNKKIIIKEIESLYNNLLKISGEENSKPKYVTSKDNLKQNYMIENEILKKENLKLNKKLNEINMKLNKVLIENDNLKKVVNIRNENSRLNTCPNEFIKIKKFKN